MSIKIDVDVILHPGLTSVIGERIKGLEKGRTAENDFKINKDKQLSKIASILLYEVEARELVLRNFVLEGQIIENWDNSIVYKYLKLLYEDRVRIAAALLVGELDRLDFINNNNINGNV